MNWIRQTWAVTAQSLKNIPQRLGSSLAALVGVAGVVLVFVAVLSMASGFQKTLESGGGEGNVIALRSASTSELDSSMAGQQARVIKDTPGIARNGDELLASAELYVMVDLPMKSSQAGANVPLRGVEPAARSIRGNIEMVEGRWFEPGTRELVAGVGAQGQFEGLTLGNTLRLGNEDWTVVGVFAANGGINESELWGDVRVLQGAYRRGNNFNSVHFTLADPNGLKAIVDTLTADPRVSLKVVGEKDYYAEQSQALATFINLIGYGIAVLMALGATFGAINTMYSTVSERAREIGTLRALGFSNSSIMVSVLAEALLLATVGGLMGGAIAWLLFNGFTVSTLNWASFSQVVFAFAVTPQLIFQGLVLALGIGLLGGLLPAFRAARLPVSEALRAI